MTDIKGHAVRAMYLYAGMCDVAYYTNDAGYLTALNRLWDSTVYRNMYITGGIGSSRENEGFSGDYNLPNDTAYCETCASVGMVLWNHRMNLFYSDSKYADIVEKCLFNGILSGISLSGDHFFYDNKLEVHKEMQREEWFGVSCCPTQMARFLPSVGNYIYAAKEDGIWINQYIGSRITEHIASQEVSVSMKTDYPWDGKINIEVNSEVPTNFEVNLRIPSWCKAYTVYINNMKCKYLYTEKGYVKLQRGWAQGEKITLELSMPIEQVIAHPKVKQNRYKVAIQRGPVVYCAEEVDNKKIYEAIKIGEDTVLKTRKSTELEEITEIVARNTDEQEYIFVPYYSWANRQSGKMKVWQDQK